MAAIPDIVQSKRDSSCNLVKPIDHSVYLSFKSGMELSPCTLLNNISSLMTFSVFKGVDTPFLTVLKTWTSLFEHTVIFHVCVRLEFPEASACAPCLRISELDRLVSGFAPNTCILPLRGRVGLVDHPYPPPAVARCHRLVFAATGNVVCRPALFVAVEAGLRTGRKGVLIADLPRSYPSSRAETTPVMTDMWPSAPSQDLDSLVQIKNRDTSRVRTVSVSLQERIYQFASLSIGPEGTRISIVENQLSRISYLRVSGSVFGNRNLGTVISRFMAAQSSEEVVVMTAALEQGTTPQSEASISMSYPPRSPIVHPVWAPQLYQAREPTTFELMRMIGDLQRSVADLAYGMSASPPAAPYAGNFVPQEPPLLGRIVIELSQPEVASGYSHDMPAPTQTLDQAEARGKDKAKVDADPIEQLLWAVEALKVRGMSKQQTSAIVTKAVDDAFPAPIKGNSSQAENRDGPRHAQTIPVVPNPAPGKVQKAKAAPADPFASASGKNPQTAKYLPRGRRVFHDLHMPLSRALLILAKNGHLKPLEPRPLPKNLPATHDATLYCAYHQQSGHSTDGCSRLRHEVQDLTDNKVILPPTSGKPVTTQLLDFEGSDTSSM
ncbi:hypothetical protein HYC85_029284 [Camellia sinensis]|uniref:Uncharacterized protein n=1 Tax=Camellia sinensis TaxID=4442 RepID=A0A7J7FXJ6_CAMSI|nr:hypothetical protein HYC85_029284 [Camellia sinensis]